MRMEEERFLSRLEHSRSWVGAWLQARMRYWS
jgi:hypothetical protein